MAGAGLSFPLVPRGRLVGLSFGSMRSLRRGPGSETAGSRPYAPGDDVKAIDWAASARLSSARAADEFVVRERFADEGPRVVIVWDRRPQMSPLAYPLPWLDKAAAARGAVELIVASAVRAGGFIGYLDFGDGSPFWRPPRAERGLGEIRERWLAEGPFQAPDGWLGEALGLLVEHRRSVTPGSFVFILSDFLPPPPGEAWLAAIERRLDVVPVVVQDPTWEQSFPDVGGIVLPLSHPAGRRPAPVFLTAREARRRRRANEARLAAILAGLRRLQLEPVLVSSAEPAHILGAFLAWAELRRVARRGGW